jgi:hypothetical protein
MIALRKPVAERIQKFIIPEPNSGCHLWLGSMNEFGYGKIGRGGKYGGATKAHLVCYEIANGPVPKGMELDHLCRNPACVNPDHLEPVTRRENILRGSGPKITKARHAARTHCRNGHELTPENTMIRKLPNGWIGRRCRICFTRGRRR